MRYVDPTEPVDESCLNCGELIDDGETAAMVCAEGAIRWLHIECQMIGTLGHFFGVCRCFGFEPTSHDAARELMRRVVASRVSSQ